MSPVLPWFLPLALGVAALGTSTARGLVRRETGRRVEATLLLALVWFPVLAWLIVQFTPFR